MTLTIDRQGDIAIITIDNPPVNAFGQALRESLWDAVRDLDANAAVRTVVLRGAGRTFIAGADVTEFGKPPVPPHLPDLIARIEGRRNHGPPRSMEARLAVGWKWRLVAAFALQPQMRNWGWKWRLVAAFALQPQMRNWGCPR